MKEFFTQSQNFIGAQQTGIDPRTGVFALSLPLASIQANYGQGPSVGFTLTSQSSSITNQGFGIGFGLAFTIYDKKNKLLQLSTGEQYLMEDTPVSFEVKQKKLHNFIFERFPDHYKVTYKSGLVEILDSPSSSHDIKQTVRIETYEGHYVELDWLFKGFNRLAKISDAHHALLEVDYTNINQPIVTVYPGEEEEYTIQLELFNSYLKKLTQEEEGYTWMFDYNSAGFLQRIEHPTGLVETVDYQDNVFRFPNDIYPALPAAVRHTLSPKRGQPDLVKSYTYTSNNYLGFGSGLHFEADRDNLYTVMTDYTYGSIETQHQDNLSIEIQRTYNNFHLNTRELTIFSSAGQANSMEVVLEYYATIGVAFAQQPNQFQFVKKRTTTWRDAQNKSRTEVHLTEFNSDGNATVEVQPNGNRTTLTWYSAQGEQGCPAEPHGFVRFLKQSIVVPNQDDYSTPTQKEEYTYENLGNSDLIVPAEQRKYSDGVLLQSRLYEYEDNPNRLDYGRQTSIHDKIYSDGASSMAYDSNQTFEFEVNGDEIVEETTFTGHDGCEATTSARYSAFTQRVLSETSAQGVVTCYTYDSMGRPLSQTLAEGTTYESTSYWQYELTSQGPVTHYTNALDIQAKVYFDGLGREIRKEGLDREGTGIWQEIVSQEYSSLGELMQTEVRDVQNSNNRFTQYGITATVTFDSWGQKKALDFTNGIVVNQQDNPVALTHLRWQSGGSMRSGELKKTLHLKSQLLDKEERINLQGQVVATKLYYWDGLGRLREEVDELGHSTKRTYDAYGRVLTQTHADGSVLTYSYVPFLTGDEIASLRVKSSNGQQWLLGEQTFDSLGRLLETETGGRTTEYHYEGVNPLPAMMVKPDGVEIAYEYIAELGNVIRCVEAEGIVQEFEYDSVTGGLLESTEGAASTENYWSNLGLLEGETLTVNGDSYDTAYQWTLRGEPIAHSDITGAETVYERDIHGRVHRIVDQDVTADLFYDDLGRLKTKKVKDNHATTQITTAYEYNDFNQAQVETLTDNKGGQLRLTRTWLKNGLLDKQTTQLNGLIIKTEEYTYDVRNRLTNYGISGSEFPSDGYGQSFRNQEYVYDALNNLTTVTTTLENQQQDVARYFYGNAADPTQLTRVTHSHGAYPSVIDLEYDVCGRMTLDEAGRTLHYDAFGRLAELEGQEDSQYQYNAQNQLVNQTVQDDKNCQLYYRGEELVNQVLVEEDKKVRWIKNGASCMAVNNDSEITLTANGQNESLLWTVKDRDAQGELHTFGAYGQGEVPDYVPAFTGERKDPISGHYHLGNGYRAYSPALMRFTCPDDLSPFDAGGINAYAYCAGDPINLIDPSGHSAMRTAGLFTGGIIGQGLGRLGAGGGIALGIVGIFTSVATFGASMATMGVMMASFSLVISLAAEATGIASIAIGSDDPDKAAKLGWFSLGLGIVGAALGSYSKSSTSPYMVTSRRNSANSVPEEIPLQDLGRRASVLEDLPFPEQRIEREDVSYLLDGGKRFQGTYLRNNNPLGEDSLLVTGHAHLSGGTFTTDRNITILAPLNTGLRVDSVVDYAKGGPYLFNSKTYKAGEEFPNFRITGPNVYGFSLEDSIAFFQQKIKYDFPHTFFAISSEIKYVNFAGLLRGVPPKFTHILLACCTMFFRRHSAPF